MDGEQITEIHLTTKMEPIDSESEMDEKSNMNYNQSSVLSPTSSSVCSTDYDHTKIILEKFYSELTVSQNQRLNGLTEVILN
jgi:hypothetical protein